MHNVTGAMWAVARRHHRSDAESRPSAGSHSAPCPTYPRVRAQRKDQAGKLGAPPGTTTARYVAKLTTSSSGACSLMLAPISIARNGALNLFAHIIFRISLSPRRGRHSPNRDKGTARCLHPAKLLASACWRHARMRVGIASTVFFNLPKRIRANFMLIAATRWMRSCSQNRRGLYYSVRRSRRTYAGIAKW